MNSNLMNSADRLSQFTMSRPIKKFGQGYTYFVRSMRWVLPLAALALIAVVIAWPKMEKQLVIVPKETIVQQPQNEIGQNELLNPVFDSVDSNNHPIKVIAQKALQNQDNPDLIQLEILRADLQTRNAEKIGISADTGTYEHNTKKLFLQNNVIISHQSGYQLRAEELRIDMNAKEAFSDKNVTVDGNDATIHALGLDGNMTEGHLVFKGPAILLIHNKKLIEQRPQ